MDGSDKGYGNVAVTTGDDLSFLMDEQLMGYLMMMEQCGISLDKLMETGRPCPSPSGVGCHLELFSVVTVPSNKESDFKEAMIHLRHVPALISWRLFRNVTVCRIWY
jgi:hypothetical protein